MASPPRARLSASALGMGRRSTISPLARTQRRERIWSAVVPKTRERIPAELFPTIPPKVATSEVDVSAPKTSPCGSTRALSSPWITPGSTEHQRPSRSISRMSCISEVSSMSPGAVA